MHNLLLFLILLVFTHSHGQDSTAAVIDPPKIIELKDTVFVEGRTFDPAFQKKYSDSDFIYEAKAVERTAWDRFMAWAAEQLRSLFNMASPEKAEAVTRLILRIILGIIVLAAVYVIARHLLEKEGRWIFGRNTKRLIQFDSVEKNLQSTDFEKLVGETIKNGDMRLAIRYYYLWLLKKLSEQGIIQWDPDKTNTDYLYEIGDVKRKEDFAYLSYLYNHIWYGEILPDDRTFAKAQHAFESVIRTVK